jgi:hypothetical protein
LKCGVQLDPGNNAGGESACRAAGSLRLGYWTKVQLL